MIKKLLATAVVCLFSINASASDEYDACYSQAIDDEAVALCMKAETARLMKEIQQTYLELSKNPQTKDWNKGDGLKNGNLRDMYNSWLAYRNRLCSLNAVATENMYGSTDYHRESCFLELTSDHQKILESILLSANGTRDEEH